jgi:hypothetical protein
VATGQPTSALACPHAEWVESEIDRWRFTEAARGGARREIAQSRAALAEPPVT